MLWLVWSGCITTDVQQQWWQGSFTRSDESWADTATNHTGACALAGKQHIWVLQSVHTRTSDNA
jgi:hypothetical protein